MEQYRRFEFKYVLPMATALALEADFVRYGMKPDPYSTQSSNKSYTVTSLYFDSPRLEHYADKAGGFLRRKKIRVRIYAPSLTSDVADIWLEQKAKHNMLISKDRIRLLRSQYEVLHTGSTLSLYRELRHEDPVGVKKIFYTIFLERMRPHIIVRYMRKPLIWSNQNDLRITFDSHLEACVSNDLRYTRRMQPVIKNGIMFKNYVVLEVKFAKLLPHWFRKIIAHYELERMDFSKYGLSVETLYRYHPIPR